MRRLDMHGSGVIGQIEIEIFLGGPGHFLGMEFTRVEVIGMRVVHVHVIVFGVLGYLEGQLKTV